MAATMFFEKTIVDKERSESSLELEFGRSSYYGGENLSYIKVDGKLVILDEASGREIWQAMQNLGQYLGYDRES